MKKMRLRLVEQNARELLRNLWAQVLLPMIANGKAMWITIEEETRTLPQNAKFHAICSDLAKSKMEWGGKKRKASEWKVLLVSGHAHATSEGVEVLPGIEGEFVNIRESTALMSITRGSSLIEYSVAFCAENGVKLTDEEEYLSLGLLHSKPLRIAA